MIIIMLISLYLPALILANDSAIYDELREMLRHRIEAQPLESGYIEVMGESTISQITLPDFYRETGFEPIWAGDDTEIAYGLKSVILDSFNHGLNPDNYHLEKIRCFLPENENQQHIHRLTIRERIDLELLLTDAFLLLATHHLSGQLNPETIDPTWHITRDEVDLKSLLFKIRDGQRVQYVINDILPQNKEYHQLVRALARYREISLQGGWPEVSGGTTLRHGDRDNRIPQIRKRLALAGDYSGTELESDRYDDELRDAVIQFQNRHGLDADAAIGPRTIAALNTPVETRLIQTLVNLERWRWLRYELGSRHIRVNIANFLVEVFENDEVILQYRAIVGRNYRQTPVFSARMTYLVLSPFWHIPPGIAANDILPGLRANPNYTRERNMKIFDGWGANAKEIDPSNVNWQEITRSNLRYRFRQDPGPANALGDVKFMFPNKYHVYLHDTPARELFTRTVRDFSSGCIRVQNPLQLAEYLLQRNRGWDLAAIKRAVEQRTERTVTLAEPIWVHILYWTAWIDENGLTNFRDDIYQRDSRIIYAMQNQLNTPITEYLN